MSRGALSYDFSSQLGRDVASDGTVSLMQEEDEFAKQRQILEEMRPSSPGEVRANPRVGGIRDSRCEVDPICWTENRGSLWYDKPMSLLQGSYACPPALGLVERRGSGA